MQFWFCGLSPKNFPLQLVDKDVHKYCKMNSNCGVKVSCKTSWFTITSKNTLVIWCETRTHTSVQSVLFALQCFWIVHFWQVVMFQSNETASRRRQGRLASASVLKAHLSFTHLSRVRKAGPAVIRTAVWSLNPLPTEPSCVSMLSPSACEDRKNLSRTLLCGHVLLSKTPWGIFGCSW